jgi:dienelactone hydrolase
MSHQQTVRISYLYLLLTFGSLVSSAMHMSAQDVQPSDPRPHFEVIIRDFSPKFLDFYNAAHKEGVDENERWKLFQERDNFLAVPPTPQGKEEGRRLLDAAWSKYPASLDRIKQGSSVLSPSPQESLNSVVKLLSENDQLTGPSKQIVLVTFVGTFDRNAFAGKTSDGKPMIALPIEVAGSELTMTHEFVHIVNEALGHLWENGEQTIATLAFTEGLAMRATQDLHPNAPEYSYVSLAPDWFDSCKETHEEVLEGMIPHLLDSGQEAITRFTYGTGSTGLTREAYCGGWYAVGYLLRHGWTFKSLAHLDRAQIDALMVTVVPLASEERNEVTRYGPLRPTDHVVRKDVVHTAFRGRLYEPSAINRRRVGVIVVGGSEGHLIIADDIGPRLAALGYSVLGIDYCDGYSDARPLANIPIEEFTAAVTWLKDRVGTGAKISMIGYSRGSEAALFAASVDSQIDGIAVFSPSSVIWSALGSTDPTGKSGWSYQDKPLPFLAPLADQSGIDAFRVPLDLVGQDNPAVIPVERIHVPILLVASDDDGIWPSGQMARQIEIELHRRNQKSDDTLLLFSSASHRLLGVGPSSPVETYKSPDRTRVINFGGTSSGTEKSRDMGWEALTEFMRQMTFADRSGGTSTP